MSLPVVQHFRFEPFLSAPPHHYDVLQAAAVAVDVSPSSLPLYDAVFLDDDEDQTFYTRPALEASAFQDTLDPAPSHQALQVQHHTASALDTAHIHTVLDTAQHSEAWAADHSYTLLGLDTLVAAHTSRTAYSS